MTHSVDFLWRTCERFCSYRPPKTYSCALWSKQGLRTVCQRVILLQAGLSSKMMLHLRKRSLDS